MYIFQLTRLPKTPLENRTAHGTCPAAQIVSWCNVILLTHHLNQSSYAYVFHPKGPLLPKAQQTSLQWDTNGEASCPPWMLDQTMWNLEHKRTHVFRSDGVCGDFTVISRDFQLWIFIMLFTCVRIFPVCSMSVLRSVRQCCAGGQCFPLLTFDFQSRWDLLISFVMRVPTPNKKMSSFLELPKHIEA